jgi:hypothetical protein
MDDDELPLDVRAQRLIARCRSDIDSAWEQIDVAREGLRRHPADLAAGMRRSKRKMKIAQRRSLAGGIYTPPEEPRTVSSPRRRPTALPTRRIASKVPPT